MTALAVGVTTGENGRLVPPASFRQAMGLSGTGQVLPSLEGDAVRVTSVRRRLPRARDRLRRFGRAWSSPRSRGVAPRHPARRSWRMARRASRTGVRSTTRQRPRRSERSTPRRAMRSSGRGTRRGIGGGRKSCRRGASPGRRARRPARGRRAGRPRSARSPAACPTRRREGGASRGGARPSASGLGKRQLLDHRPELHRSREAPWPPAHRGRAPIPPGTAVGPRPDWEAPVPEGRTRPYHLSPRGASSRIVGCGVVASGPAGSPSLRRSTLKARKRHQHIASTTSVKGMPIETAAP